jgi:hypothetical protein
MPNKEWEGKRANGIDCEINDQISKNIKQDA